MTRTRKFHFLTHVEFVISIHFVLEYGTKNVVLWQKIRFVEGKVVQKPGDSNQRTFKSNIVGNGEYFVIAKMGG